MICKFVGVYSGRWNELTNLNHTRIIMFSSVLIGREVRKVAKLNSDELRDQDTSRGGVISTNKMRASIPAVAPVRTSW